MAVLNVKANGLCGITADGGFLGIIDKGEHITLPIPTRRMLISCTPEDGSTVNCFIEPCRGRLKLKKTDAVLYKWSEDIYELELCFKESKPLPPPIIIREDPWRGGILGLCGGYLIFEADSGKRITYPAPITDYKIFSSEYVLIESEHLLTALNNKLEPIFTDQPFDSYVTEDHHLKVTFTPGNMDMFTVTRIYDRHLALTDTRVSPIKTESLQDILRCFCQAVRLDMQDTALSFLTPSLKEEMSFLDIKDFLGIFDGIEYPAYLNQPADNVLALRYKIDESNYHYMCYEFKLNTTTGTKLIDDITQL